MITVRVMAVKRMLFRDEARERLLAGATRVADAVPVTLGPRAKAALGRPLVCDDGVNSAKEREVDDSFAQMGVPLVREPAERTRLQVGDGTTTAMLLAPYGCSRQGS